MSRNIRPSEDSNDAHAPQGMLASPTRDRTRGSSGADLNRPLPPLPSGQQDYEIPTLRRKPQADPPNAAPLKHNRSFSHPFPSFFGGKRAERKNSSKQEKQTVDITDDEISVHEGVGRSPNSPARNPSRNPSLKDRQPVTGKCMTCDSTVRWPQGLKVFRCSICMTINDLEVQAEQRGDIKGPDARLAFTSTRKRMYSKTESDNLLTHFQLCHCLSTGLERS
jgi:LSD1 subclass zinc finger protein